MPLRQPKICLASSQPSRSFEELHFAIGATFAVSCTTLWSRIATTGVKCVDMAAARRSNTHSTSTSRILTKHQEQYAECVWMAKRMVCTNVFDGRFSKTMNLDKNVAYTTVILAAVGNHLSNGDGVKPQPVRNDVAIRMNSHSGFAILLNRFGCWKALRVRGFWRARFLLRCWRAKARWHFQEECDHYANLFRFHWFWLRPACGIEEFRVSCDIMFIFILW